MASIHLTCQVCGRELKPEPYMDWAIGERGQRTFTCKKGSYSEDRGGPPHCRLEIVFPEEEVYQYELSYESNGKIYQFSGCLDSVVPGRRYPILSVYRINTSSGDKYHSFSEVFSLDRAYPINCNQDLKEQCHKIMEKVKSLVVFA